MSTVSVIYDLIGRDNASSAFKSASSSADKMASRVTALGAAVEAASLAVAAGAVAVAKKSIDMATDFQSAMEKIHTQAGGSQKDVDSLTKSVLALAPSTQQGPQALAEALYHLKSVGLDNADAMKALKTSSDLAAVGGSNLEDTTNALAGAWRSGIKGAQTFSQTAATVNAIIGAGNMQMTDLVGAISTGILPAAKTFGVSLQSVGAALATMTDEGVPAQDAATRLRMTLALMGAPSAEAAKALSSIGLSSTALGDKMRGSTGLIGALTDLKTHLTDSGMTATEQAQVITRAFGGGQNSAAIMTLLNNLGLVEKKQQQINATTGSYGAAVAAQQQTASAQFAKLKSSLDTLGIKVGLALLPPVSKFVSFLATTGVPMVEKFAGKVEHLLPVAQIEADAKKIIQSIEQLLGMGGGAAAKAPKAVSPSALYSTPSSNSALISKQTSATVGTAVSKGLSSFDFGKIAGTFATDMISMIFTAMGKVNWVSAGGNAAAMLLEFAIGLASEILDPVTWFHVLQKAWLPILGLLLTVLTIPFGGEGGTLFKGLADVLEHLPFGKLISWIPRMIDNLLTPLAKAWRGLLGKAFSPIADVIKGVFDDAKNWLLKQGEDILLGLARGAGKGWRGMLGWLGKLPMLVLKALFAPYKWLYEAGTSILEGLLGGAEHELPGVLGWLAKLGAWILKALVKPYIWLYDAGTSVLRGLLNGAEDFLPGVFRWLGSLPGKIVAQWAKAGDWLLDAGRQLLMGLIHGIEDQAGDVIGVVKSLGSKLIGAFKSVLSIMSPSKVFYQLGSYITQGLGSGISETAQQATAKAADLAAKVRNAFAAGQITAAEEKTLLDQINGAAQAQSPKLTKTMQQIGLEMGAGLIGSLENATSSSAVNTAVNKLIGYVKTAWSAGDITVGEASSLTSFLEADNTKLGSLATQRAKIVSTIKTADTYAANVTSNVESSGSLSNIMSGLDGNVTASGIVSGLRSTLQSISQFNVAVKKLGKLGLRKDLLDQIIQMGPTDGLTVANALLDGPGNTISQVNSVQSAIVAGSTTLGQTAASAMYDSGKAAGEGFLTGLQAQEKAITAEMTKIAQGMVSTVKAELGIHSPSTVMHGHGHNTALGLALGIEAGLPKVTAAALKLSSAASVSGSSAASSLLSGSESAALSALAPVAPALSASELKAIVAAGKGSDGGEFSGSLYLDSGELLGLVRGEIRKSEQKTKQAVKSGSGSRR